MNNVQQEYQINLFEDEGLYTWQWIVNAMVWHKRAGEIFRHLNLSKVFYASVFVWPNFSSHGKGDFLPREESGRRFWEFLPPWLLLLMAGFAICEPVDKTDSNREGRSTQFQTLRNSTKSKKKCLLSSWQEPSSSSKRGNWKKRSKMRRNWWKGQTQQKITTKER